MGVIDEHWCSLCRRPLDKVKDSYVEFELLNIKAGKRRKFRKPRGLICKACLDRDPKLAEAFTRVLGRRRTARLGAVIRFRGIGEGSGEWRARRYLSTELFLKEPPIRKRWRVAGRRK